MSIGSLVIYKQDAIAKILSPDSANADKEGYVTHLEGVKINIQPAGPEYVALTPLGDTGQVFRGFTTTSGIRTGMVIVTSGTVTISGMRYKVVGDQEFRGPIGTHFELTLTRPNE